jgi:TolB-like protein
MRAESDRRIFLRLAGLLPAAALLPACVPGLVPQDPGTSSVMTGSAPPTGREIGRVAYASVDHMLAGAPQLARDTPIAVATLTDAQQIETSTPFGHFIAEIVRSRLAQQGMRVSELRMRSAVRMHPVQGELSLARNPREVLPPPSVAAIVNGTYTVGGRLVFVSLRMVSAADGRILSAVDFAVPRFPDADEMLTARPANARR